MTTRRSFLISLASAAALPAVSFAQPSVPRLALYSQQNELLAVSDDLTEFFAGVRAKGIDSFRMTWLADRAVFTGYTRWQNCPLWCPGLHGDRIIARYLMAGDTIQLYVKVTA